MYAKCLCFVFHFKNLLNFWTTRKLHRLCYLLNIVSILRDWLLNSLTCWRSSIFSGSDMHDFRSRQSNWNVKESKRCTIPVFFNECIYLNFFIDTTYMNIRKSPLFIRSILCVLKVGMMIKHSSTYIGTNVLLFYEYFYTRLNECFCTIQYIKINLLTFIHLCYLLFPWIIEN